VTARASRGSPDRAPVALLEELREYFGTAREGRVALVTQQWVESEDRATGATQPGAADQKRAILLQWKDQLQQLQAADDEGMQRSEGAAGATSDVLGRVTSIPSRIDAVMAHDQLCRPCSSTAIVRRAAQMGRSPSS
jgi:hypothetical protein